MKNRIIITPQKGKKAASLLHKAFNTTGIFGRDVIPGPYNVSFNDRKTKPISLKNLSKQTKEKKLDKYESMVVLGGKNYVEIFEQIFIGKSILNPLHGCKGIGYMLGRLNNAIVSNKCL